MMRKCRSSALALILLLATPLAAQTTATLTGAVSSSGVAVSGATVTITSPSLQGDRSTVTGASGTYQFSALPPGDYSIQVVGAQLTPVTIHVALHVAQTTRADVEMSPVTYININVTSEHLSV